MSRGVASRSVALDSHAAAHAFAFSLSSAARFVVCLLASALPASVALGEWQRVSEELRALCR